MAFTINQVFHTSMALVYTFTLYRGFQLRIPFLIKQFKDYDPGMLKYLTIWNVIIQAVFFFICMLNDWFGTNAVNPKKPPFIRKLKDFFHASLGFPGAMLVGIVFWTLMFIDRELIFPEGLEPHFPWWLNHLMHTMVVVSILLETVLAPRKYPKRLTGILTTLALEFVYAIWMHVIYYKSGAWVYPVMNIMSFPMRLVFLASMMALGIIIYIAGEALDNVVWGNEYNKQQKSHTKSK